LKELLGFKHVRNYDGSWMEWTRKHPSGIKKAG
jgi:3-mercaptopyruvate sulfurtransferase SseA